MQGLKTVLILGGVLAAVVAIGLWMGMRDPGLGEEDGSGSAAGGAPSAAPPPDLREDGSARAPAGHGIGAITGRVIHFRTRQPASDVIVRLTGGPRGFPEAVDVTDENGGFLFEALPAGSPLDKRGYEIRIEHGEYAPVRMPDLGVFNGEVTDAGTLFLEKAVSFVVRVTDGGGNPIPAAKVMIYAASRATTYWDPQSWVEQVLKLTEIPTPLHLATAAQNGEAEVGGIPGGFYAIAADAPGYARATIQRLVGADRKPEPIVLRLGKGFALDGRVTDAEGGRVAGRLIASPFEFQAWNSRGFARLETPIDEEGAYRLSGLPAGALALTVLREDGRPVPAGAVSIPDLEHFDIRLGEGAVVSGVVSDSDGAPVAEAEVRALVWNAMGNTSVGATAVTDEEGSYEIRELPAGNLGRLQVLKDGFARYPPPEQPWLQTPLSAGTALRFDVTLEKGYALGGQVTRADTRKPVSGARVVAIPRTSQGQGARESVTADENGRYRFEALAPGEYALQVAAEGTYQPGFPNQWQVGRGRTEIDEKWKVEILPGAAETTKDLEVSAGGTVLGIVEDSHGKPVGGVRIQIQGTPWGVDSYFTGEDGRFEIGGVKEGPGIRLAAWATGRSAMSDPFDMPAGGRVEGIRLVLKTTCTVSGTVTLSDGNSPEGGSAWTVQGDPRKNPWLLSRPGNQTPIAADGTFTIEEVPAGKMAVVADVPGYAKMASDVTTISEGDAVTGIDMTLAAGVSITGRVHTDGGDPVEGARISATGGGTRGMYPGLAGYGGNQVMAQTDGEGRFTVGGLAEGKYTITARKDGFTPISEHNVIAGTNDVLDLVVREGGEIRGRVLSDRNEPVAGMRISARPIGTQSRNPVPQGSSSQDGSFRLTGVAEGTYEVTASPPHLSGLNYTSGKVEGVRPGDAEVEIRVRRGLSISGRVEEPGGSSVSGLPVMASLKVEDPKPNQPVPTRQTTTDPDGSFVIPGLEAGEYQVSVTPRAGFAVIRIEKVTAGTERLRIVLHEAFEITGTVVGPDGAGVRSVSIRAMPMGSPTTNAGWSGTNQQGEFRIKNLAPGAYHLVFSAAGRFATRTLDDVAAGTTGVNVRLEEGRAIAGIAVDAADRPVKGVLVIARPVGEGDDSRNRVNAQSNDEGKFRLGGLLEGKYEVQAYERSQGLVLHKALEVEAGKEDVKLSLAAGLTIRGQVVDAKGKGVSGGSVQTGGWNRQWSRLDSEGFFTLKGLPEGKIDVTVWVAGMSGPMTKTLTAGDDAVQIRLE